MRSNNLTITYANSNVEIPMMLIDHLSVSVSEDLLVTNNNIVSIEIVIAMKYSFVIEIDILKEIWILLQCIVPIYKIEFSVCNNLRLILISD